MSFATESFLPLSCYFSEEMLQKEQQCLFYKAPQYIGHRSMVAHPGDYFVPPHCPAKALIQDQNGTLSLLSNLCRHRQAIMLKGHGHIDKIVCPLHRWTYHLDGRLAGAPLFDPQPQCSNLAVQPMTDWRGFLFEGQSSFAQQVKMLPIIRDIPFEDYVFERIEVETCAYNWKIFTEVYLENYHVSAFHPGLGHFLDCSALEWHSAPTSVVHTAPLHWDNIHQQNNPCPHFNAWGQAIAVLSVTKKPQYGAIWAYLYPGIMIECYPSMIVLSYLIPKTPEQTLNIIEFYHTEELVAFEPELIAHQQQAYLNTMPEDDEICARIYAGKAHLHQHGLVEHGPFQQPLEAAIPHFHRYYRQQMGL